MRCGVLLAALAATAAAQAMPLGLRTAMWGVASANRRAVADEAFPELGATATAAEIAAALDSATDGALAANIADAADYDDFRNWAREVGAAAVKESGTAWLSFALDADALVEKELTDKDVTIESFSVNASGGADSGAMVSSRPTMSLKFAVDGVTVGTAAIGERIKTVLGVEGAAELKESAFSSDNLTVSLAPMNDGRIKATVTRRDEGGATGVSPDSFFLRVKVK